MKKRQIVSFAAAAVFAAVSVTGCSLFSRTAETNTAQRNSPEVVIPEDAGLKETRAETTAAAPKTEMAPEIAEAQPRWSILPSHNQSAAAAAKTADIAAEMPADGYLGEIYDYGSTDFPSAGGEEYSRLNENGFIRTSENPVSTFAADVDTASYSNLRRLLSYGYRLQDLPENAVRIEELINYFSYDYEGPRGNEPFGVTTVLGDCPWNKDAKLLSIGLQTEDIDFSDAPASNLVFLIDVSGSMYSEDKLPLLQNAFCMLADQLDGDDTVSIVTYAGEDSIVLDGVSGDRHDTIRKAIRSLEAGGSTNGSAGIVTAYELAEEHFIEGGNNRVILATDGDLNVGVTTVGGLERLISEKKETGVFLSVLGFGSGNIKDNRMETLADKGNGNYAFIDSVKEAKKVLVKELSSSLLTVCKDVKLQVKFDPDAVKEYRLIGYANRMLEEKDFDDDTKDGGEIGAGHSVTAMYELVLNRGWENTEKLLDLDIRFKRPDAAESELLTYEAGSGIYREEPGNDFLFQSAVAEFGLLASSSRYAGGASLREVRRILEAAEPDDEYKEEFYEMILDLYD